MEEPKLCAKCYEELAKWIFGQMGECFMRAGRELAKEAENEA